MKIKRVPIKLRRPDNEYMKSYVKAVEKGYAKRRSVSGKFAEPSVKYGSK